MLKVLFAGTLDGNTLGYAQVHVSGSAQPSWIILVLIRVDLPAVAN